MRILLTIFALATVCLAADWRQDCPVKDDWRGQLNWLNEPIVLQTNQVQTIAERGSVTNELPWIEVCKTYGIEPQGVAMQNLGVIAAANSNAIPGSVAVAYFKAQPTLADPDFGKASVTNTTEVITPTRYRWQDYGLPKAPTMEDVR
jgi:hypothetical protein